MTDMADQQRELLTRMEPVASNTAVDVLASGGMKELAIVSTAISTRRIADVLEGMARALHRQGDISDDEMVAMGIQP